MHSVLQDVLEGLNKVIRRDIESLRDFGIEFVTTFKDAMNAYNQAVSEHSNRADKNIEEVQRNNPAFTRQNWSRAGEVPEEDIQILRRRYKELKSM